VADFLTPGEDDDLLMELVKNYEFDTEIDISAAQEEAAIVCSSSLLITSSSYRITAFNSFLRIPFFCKFAFICLSQHRICEIR